MARAVNTAAHPLSIANFRAYFLSRLLGTIAIVVPENQWWRELNLGSPEAILRIFIQQSGCFTLVNRGRSMQSRAMERAMADQGTPLERIKQLINGITTPPPLSKAAGDISVISKVFIAPGVELHLEPQIAGLSPEKLRLFVRSVLTTWEEINASE